MIHLQLSTVSPTSFHVFSKSLIDIEINESNFQESCPMWFQIHLNCAISNNAHNLEVETLINSVCHLYTIQFSILSAENDCAVQEQPWVFPWLHCTSSICSNKGSGWKAIENVLSFLTENTSFITLQRKLNWAVVAFIRHLL